MSKYKCNICGQTALTEQQEKDLIAECIEKLPQAILEKRKDTVLGEIVANYPIGKVTVYNKILKHHKVVTKPPKKERITSYNIVRATDDEITKLVNYYEKENMGPSQMVAARVLGDRTPSVVAIYGILRRNSKVYQINNDTTEKSELRNNILADYVDGLSTEELSSKYDKSHKTITDYIGESGTDISQGLSYQQKMEMYVFYVNFEGKDAVGETQKKYNLSPTSIRRITKELVTNHDLHPRDNSNSYRTYTLNQDYFEIIDSEYKAYTVGYIATDGNVSRNVVTIELQRSDSKILGSISYYIGSNKPIMNTLHFNKMNNKYHESAKISFISKKLIKDLSKLGIKENKSLSLDVNLELIPKVWHKAFWRGCVDGDGWVYNGNKIELGLCGSFELLSKFAKYLKDNLSITETIVKHHSIWKIVIDSERLSILAIKHLYNKSNIHLERKNLLLLPEEKFPSPLVYQKWIK